ncbi:MAG: BlaI/MecI/CopY family transcriptional regulator [Gemmatimonadota bacterium]
MTEKPPDGAALSALESDVMGVLWASDEALDAAEVRARLPRDLTDSTVRTILRRVESKGFAQHALEGRRYLYSALRSGPAAAARMVGSALRRYCRGSLEELLVGMVEEGVADADELRAIAARIAEDS